jgi:hypothetical protein
MEPLTWLHADAATLPWVDDTETLTADAIEAMACWQFWWHDDRNLVMLVDDDA